ncbi:unnamed protein product, partial [Amaranthus hypochondriacus]
MATYNLDESQDIFIFPEFYGDEFKYRMVRITNEEGDRTKIRSINLKNDKLIIYGTEIQKSLLKRLSESLDFKGKNGFICVNCDGACYLVASGKNYRPIQNVIFDWSPFGVTVPNSVHESIKIRLDEQGKIIDQLNNQISSNEANLKGFMEEIEDLKVQVSTYKKNMEKAYERLALVDFELQLYKVELESSKKIEEDLLDELCDCREEKKNMEVDSRKIKYRCSMVNDELRSTKIELESSIMRIKELECEVSSCKKARDELEGKL